MVTVEAKNSLHISPIDSYGNFDDLVLPQELGNKLFNPIKGGIQAAVGCRGCHHAQNHPDIALTSTIEPLTDDVLRVLVHLHCSIQKYINSPQHGAEPFRANLPCGQEEGTTYVLHSPVE